MWVYPAGNGDVEDGVDDPNDHTGGIPEVADAECLAQCNIPWCQKKGTKVYLKVRLLESFANCRPRWRVLMNRENMLSLNIFTKHLLRMPPGFVDVVLVLVILSKWMVKSPSSEQNQALAKQTRIKLAWNLL
jgi:hypothetical protein